MSPTDNLDPTTGKPLPTRLEVIDALNALNRIAKKQPTDTNQASELYELCKEVYERLPDWDGDKPHKSWYQMGHYFSDGKEYQPGEPFLEEHSGQFPDFPYKYIAPLYNSDYLLEKLPPVLLTNDDPLRMRDTWTAGTYAWYENDWITDVISDTPLKALLKLTIALSEAGELK